MDWQKASAELSRKLDPAHVRSRKQGGSQVAYIEGWHAIAEANRIFGFGAWDRETVELRQLGEPREVNGNIRVDYMARVRITVWAGGDGRTIRDGCGFGQGIDRDVGHVDRAHRPRGLCRIEGAGAQPSHRAQDALHAQAPILVGKEERPPARRPRPEKP